MNGSDDQQYYTIIQSTVHTHNDYNVWYTNIISSSMGFDNLSPHLAQLPIVI